jgi:uncharacterized lipoprotein YmbA
MAAGIVLLAASGCAVTPPPVQHLQLVSSGAGEGTGDRPRVYLDRVELPDYLLRDELIHRDDDYSLTYLYSIRWAEPLDIGIQRVLAEELAAQMNTRRLRRYPMPAGDDMDLSLRVTVERFERVGDHAELRATGYWQDGSDAASTPARVTFEDRIAIPSQDSGEAARALSELLGRFARVLSMNRPRAQQ